MKLLASAFLGVVALPPLALCFVTSPKTSRGHAVLISQQNSVYGLPQQRQQASTTTRLFTEPLATEGDWSAFLDDENTGLVYYFNKKTGDSLWEPPTKTFPSVKLRGSDRRRARDKQLEYVKAVQMAETSQQVMESKPRREPVTAEQGDDWFSSIFAEDEIAQQEIPAETTTDKKGFLSGLLDAGDDATTTTTPEKKTVEEEPKKGFFSSLLEGGEDATSTAPAVEETPVEEEVAEAPKKGFFTSFLEDVSAAPATVEEEPTKTEPEPVVEEAKDDWFGRAVGSMFTKTAEQATVQETPAEIITPEEAAKPITLDMSSYVLPHPNKVFWGGEDAVFTQGRSFGVFDGVSGAFKLDGVPLYSKTLAKLMKKNVGNDGLDVRQMTKLLTDAAETADKDATGASTAVVASISENGYLRALNLGDSACIVVRNGRVAGKTREISHYFECPYQLSDDSPDRPRDGTKLNMELVRGDLILMASDGVFDNLSDEKLLEVIENGDASPARIAKRVADESRKVSLNRQVVTPYSKLARKYGDPDFSDGIGGKVDDISCVVVRYE